jgi:hypothetical protein
MEFGLRSSDLRWDVSVWSKSLFDCDAWAALGLPLCCRVTIWPMYFGHRRHSGHPTKDYSIKPDLRHREDQ